MRLRLAQFIVVWTPLPLSLKLLLFRWLANDARMDVPDRNREN